MTPDRGIALVLALLTGCDVLSSSQPRDPPPCLFQFGEFPPAACAFLVGTVTDSVGIPLVGRAFRADSFIVGGGFRFSSSTSVADAAGRLELVVFRDHLPGRPPQPDTATVPLLLYLVASDAKALAPARARVTVHLSFAPIGQVVETTFVNPRLPVSAPTLRVGGISP